MRTLNQTLVFTRCVLFIRHTPEYRIQLLVVHVRIGIAILLWGGGAALLFHSPPIHSLQLFLFQNLSLRSCNYTTLHVSIYIIIYIHIIFIHVCIFITSWQHAFITMYRKPNLALLQTRLAKYGHHFVSIYCGLRHLLLYSTIFVWWYPLLRLMAPKDFHIGMGWNHQDIFDTEPCGKCWGLVGSILEQRKTSKDAVVQANPAFSVPVRNNTRCLTTPSHCSIASPNSVKAGLSKAASVQCWAPCLHFHVWKGNCRWMSSCHLPIFNIHANGKLM